MMKAMINIEHSQHSLAEEGEASLEQAVIKAVAAIEALVQPLDAWDTNSITDSLQSPFNQLFIARIDGKIVGYCLYQQLYDQAEILRIGTHPNYQRRGIASQLLLTLKRRLIEAAVESILLEVRADNAAAISLYTQQGFRTIHTRSGYYQAAHAAAVDALIMQCWLTDKG